jgi:Transposase DDE domain
LQFRLIVSRIVLPDESLYAQWLLLTNLPESVRAEQIAQWYVWRWKVESYFKLLKSSGHNLEHWQQESVEAIAKRLLVTAMAAVVIWQLARSQAPESEQARNLLVRLSGRQVRRDRAATESAMLTGLWTLLATLSAFEQYSLDELRQVARLSLPGFFRYDTG